MAESDPFSQMFNLFAAPLAGTIQSIEQFRKGVDEFLRGVENFNRTMENLNETSERINGLLIEVEEPLRAAVPQVTRTVKAADEMMRVVSGPAIAVAPGLQILAETLNNPALRQLPNQVSQMNEVLAEVSNRLAPLGSLAESAGGLFGGLKLPGFPNPAKPESSKPKSPKPEASVVTDDPDELVDADEGDEPEPKPKPKPEAKKRAPKKKTASRKKTAS